MSNKVKDDLKWIAVLVYKFLPCTSSFNKVLCLSLISSMIFGVSLKRKNSLTWKSQPLQPTTHKAIFNPDYKITVATVTLPTNSTPAQHNSLEASR